MAIHKEAVRLTVNGVSKKMTVPVDEVLVDTVRREFGVTSVRETCGIGICGTCTILIDGKIVSGCLTLTWMAQDRELLTSEGLLSADGRLSAVQEAFVTAGAYQCSFCIPGMVLAVHTCLQEIESPSLEKVRHYLAGNLCRCGTYAEILDAVRALLPPSDPVG